MYFCLFEKKVYLCRYRKKKYTIGVLNDNRFADNKLVVSSWVKQFCYCQASFLRPIYIISTKVEIIVYTPNTKIIEPPILLITIK